MTVGELKAILASYDDSLDVAIEVDGVEDVLESAYSDISEQYGGEYLVLTSEPDEPDEEDESEDEAPSEDGN
jgi:hypothetical protein